jgi:hypothetical protein
MAEQKNRMRASLLLVLAVHSLTGCGHERQEASEPVRVDSADVAVVMNDGPDRLLEWEFEPVLDLGNVEDGPTAFFRVSGSSVGADSAGHLYVLDAGRHVVSVFDISGRHLQSYGRQGGGPGEFGFPAYLAVAPTGAAAVYDFDKRALVMFNATGAYAGLFPLEVPQNGKVAFVGPETVAAAVAIPIATGDSAELRLLLLGPDTVELSKVRRIDRFQPKQFRCPIPALPSIFLPRVVWDGHPQRVALSDGVGYEVRMYENGRLSGIWRRDLPQIGATLNLAAWEVANGDSLRVFGCAVPAEEAAAKLGYAETAPIIKNLTISPDGGVWLLRRTTVAGEYKIDILDATGAYIGTLPSQSPFPTIFRNSDEIVTVEPDELDVPHVKVYRIARTS